MEEKKDKLKGVTLVDASTEQIEQGQGQGINESENRANKHPIRNRNPRPTKSSCTSFLLPLRRTENGGKDHRNFVPLVYF